MTDISMTPASPELAAFVDLAEGEPVLASISPVRAAVRRDAAVRALETSDIPHICDLFTATFRPERRTTREAVERSIARTYLTSPVDRVRPASRVYVGSSGTIDGFMGVITLAACFRGQPMRCGILGSFMGREADRARAGLRLSRATFALDLDVMFSDTASRGSVDLSRSFGFDVLPAHSLGWLKVLSPCAMAASALWRTAPRLATGLASLTRPIDRLAGHLPHVAVPAEDAAGLLVRSVATADLARRIRPLLDRYVLRPAWDDAELAWLLAGARRHSSDGDLHAREVLDRRGRSIGVFLVYARPGGVAVALQVLAERGREAAVVTALIREAAALGATAVRGRTSPAVLAGLLWQRGILYRRAPVAIGFARQPEAHAALLSDAAYVGGLFGESWIMADGRE